MACENCKIRAQYDKNPKSLIGRFWHFHTKFCPGFKKYFNSLSAEQQEEMRKRYDLKF